LRSYHQLREYIQKGYQNFIFVALFYSLWLVSKYAFSFDPSLLSFSGRMIGEATLKGYDINKRIHVFYYSGFIFLAALALFSFISWRISLLRESTLRSAEMKMINYSSIAGIVFYFFSLWSRTFDPSLELVYCIHKVALAGFVMKWFILKGRPLSDLIGVSFYTISFVLAVSVFFLWNETSVLFGFLPPADLLITLFVSVLGTILLAIKYTRKKSLSDAKLWLNKFAIIAIPLTVIPLFSFFKDEIYFVLNRHQIYFFSPRKLYLIFLMCTAFIVARRYRKFQNSFSNGIKTNERLVALRYIPLLLIGLATYTFYNRYIYLDNEMFEAGNRFLPVMEFQKFGVVPVFEKFNSHVLSELFFGSIYTFFNGMHSREMYLYEFIYEVFWVLMVYLFMYRLSRNAYIALFTILLFPLIDTLIFDYAIISFLGIFVTDKIIREEASFKNYFILTGCVAFLVLWRIDIGYPALISVCATLIIYLVSQDRFRIRWKLFFKSLIALFAFIMLGITIISLCRNINVFEKLWSGLNYLASAQTYGIPGMGDPSQGAYKVQYFVFPVLILLGLAGILVFFKRFNISRSQRFIYTSFIFLAVYYLVNFQRGIVRHSFIEGHDNGLSSFAFFILGGSVFLFCQRRSKVYRLIAFVTISSLLLMNYKFPAPKEFNNLYSKIEQKTSSFSAIDPQPGIVRCIDTTNFENINYGNFKKMITGTLKEEQTFIDFANLPMLYYFTGKISPSYFYQNPLSVHNDYLQNSYISGLHDYDAPLLVFSNFPKIWWDGVDGVPNTLRHYRMAEHFFINYEPFAIVDKLCIWKRKNFELKNQQQRILSYSKSDSLQKKMTSWNQIFSTNPEKNYMFKVVLKEGSAAPEIKMLNTSATRLLKAVFVNDISHTAYFIVNDEAQLSQLSFSMETHNILNAELIACDFIPDFYSEYPHSENIANLAYIWGSFDEKTDSASCLVNLLQGPFALQKNTISYFNFASTIDKSTGNVIRISVNTDNKEPVSASLMYGSKTSGYKGAFDFLIPAGLGTRELAIRMSAQPNWFFKDIDYVALSSSAEQEIRVNKVLLLKGN
jgi:hypothetical protein